MIRQLGTSSHLNVSVRSHLAQDATTAQDRVGLGGAGTGTIVRTVTSLLFSCKLVRTVRPC